MRIKLKVARLVTLLLCLPCLGACILHGDCFFEASGQVQSCTTNEPLEGVTITLHIDDGFHSGTTLKKSFVTDANGDFAVDAGASEDCGARVTLTLRKPGFIDETTQVNGTPAGSLALCLHPTPMP